MYQIVAPILYDEPVVQNIGLFFLGVEQPLTGRNELDDQNNIVSQSEIGNENETETETAQSIPYHKRQLLDLVKKINIVRASSSSAINACYMEHPSKAYLDEASQLDRMDCDGLARGEIEGWVLAETLLKRLAKQSGSKLSWQCAFPLISFRSLAALTFGLWDDGRWTIYEDNAFNRNEHDEDWIGEESSEHFSEHFSDATDSTDSSDTSSSEAEMHCDRSASAYACCEEILAAFFFRPLGHQAVSLCQHTNLGLGIFDSQSVKALNQNRSNESQLCPVKGIRVIHGSPDPGYGQECCRDFVYAGPTRIFSKYSRGKYGIPMGLTANEMHEEHIRRFDRSITAYVERHPDRLPDECHRDMTFRLDFCVLPAAEGANDTPEETRIRTQIEAGQIPMDQLIKNEKEESDALEGESMELGSRRYNREALLLRTIPLSIYIGDDVPPCPGCGLKE
jgi:hypothetical protein